MSNDRWIISPEVAGELGEHTVLDARVHPPKVTHLHYRLEGWRGDDLLETFPCFVVSSRLAEALRASNLVGFELNAAEVTASPEFEDIYPGRVLPEFHWLNVSGHDPSADFRLTDDARLEVSDRAWDLLQRFCVSNAVVASASHR